MKLREGTAAANIAESSRRWLRHGAPTMSAAMAFYSLTSIAPVLIIAVGLAGSVLDQDMVRRHVMDAMATLLEPRASRLVAELIETPWFNRTDALGGGVALLAMVFSSTAGFSHLRDCLNRIREVPVQSATVWSVVRARALSFALVLVVGLLILGSLLLRTVLSALDPWIERGLPFDSPLFRVGELVGFLAMITVLFALVLQYLPDVRTPWRHLMVGAAVTSLLFLLGEIVIAQYLSGAGTASAFGAVGSVVVLALWVYYSCMVFLWGAELTHVYTTGRRGGRRRLG